MKRGLLSICAAACALAPVWPSLANEPIRIEQTADNGAAQHSVYLDALARLSKMIRHDADLRDFYARRGMHGYWTRGSRYNGEVDDFIDLINDSWTHGLNPFSYHLEKIRAVLPFSDEESRAELEVLLSDAYLSYAQDLSGIRVNPAPFGSHRRFWQASMSTGYLLDLLDHDDDIEDVAASFTPQGQTYQALRKALYDVVARGPETYESILPIRIDGLLHPYEQHRAVPDLRIRFGLDGAGNDYTYDDRLAAAVMRFQRDRGLKADGVVGPVTLRVINETRKGRIYQLIANLERLRWVPEHKPDKFVVVNIPSATLWAVDDGRLDFEMPVIVGRKKRPTNIFITDITGVRLNPTWTVPPTIKKEDILPKLVANPDYLKNKGMTLVSGGEAVDSARVDWATVSAADLHGMQMVQTPGAHNPLGAVRVLMPNSYNIYLHDTNEKYLFDREALAVSSGCVRMKDPRRMAEFILDGKAGWTPARIDEVLARGALKDVFIDHPIPVYLVYYTAWVDAGGGVVFGNDLYGYDDRLIKMLKDIDGLYVPVDNVRR
ncbi:MAG: L,D-transpeptidase family protein [Bdellovibrionales bacterium]